ncbi:MAG: TonB-dependent receptor [Acidobacteriota bacterium]
MFFPSSVRNAPPPHSVMSLSVAAAWACFNFTGGAWAADVANGESLEPIVVTATRTAATVSNSPAALTVITADDIKRSGAASVHEAIRKIGGFVGRLDLANGGNDKIDLRGFGDASDANTVVLLNGIRMSETDLSGARLSGVPIDLVERIEVLRGGSSVLWGEGASAGVINVVLKEGALKGGGRTSTVGASLDSLGGYGLNVSTTAPVGSWIIDASVRRTSTPGYRADSASDNDIYSAGLFWSEGNLSQQFRVISDSQLSQWPGYMTFEQFKRDPRRSDGSHSFGKTDETRFISNTQWQSGPLHAQMDIGARYRHTDTEMWGSPWGNTVGSHQLSPKLTYDFDLGGANKWVQTLGVDYQHWKRGMPAGLPSSDGTQANRAVYLYSDVELASATRVNAGVRREFVTKHQESAFNGYDRHDAVTAGELGVSQAITSQWQIYGRAAKSFRLANFDENASTPSGLPLLPQTSQDRELGVRWTARSASFNARVFRQDTTHEIMYLDLDPLDFVYCCNRNIDPVRRKGLEVDGKVAVTDTWSVSGSAQVLSAKLRSGPYEGMERVLIAPRSATVRVRYQVDESQSIQVGAQYMSPSRFADDLDNTCARRIPSQVSFDAGYSFEKDGWRLGLVASNLLNRHSYSYAYSCEIGALYPDDGQVIKASLSKQF